MKGIFPLVILSTQKVWIFKFAKLIIDGLEMEH